MPFQEIVVIIMMNLVIALILWSSFPFSPSISCDLRLLCSSVKSPTVSTMPVKYRSNTISLAFIILKDSLKFKQQINKLFLIFLNQCVYSCRFFDIQNFNEFTWINLKIYFILVLNGIFCFSMFLHLFWTHFMYELTKLMSFRKKISMELIDKAWLV